MTLFLLHMLPHFHHRATTRHDKLGAPSASHQHLHPLLSTTTLVMPLASRPWALPCIFAKKQLEAQLIQFTLHVKLSAFSRLQRNTLTKQCSSCTPYANLFYIIKWHQFMREGGGGVSWLKSQFMS